MQEKNQNLLLVTTLTAAVSLIFTTAVSVIQIQTTEATHLYGNMRWSSYVAGPLCISTSMGNTNIGLTASNNALFTAYDSINRLDSRYVIKQMANTGDCRSHVYGNSLSTGTLGVTSIGRSSSTVIIYENVAMNTNIPWTSSGCTEGYYPVRMSFAIRHEFSHWIFLKHNTVDDRTSITHPKYHCSAWDAFNSHDAGTVRAVYG